LEKRSKTGIIVSRKYSSIKRGGGKKVRRGPKRALGDRRKSHAGARGGIKARGKVEGLRESVLCTRMALDLRGN